MSMLDTTRTAEIIALLSESRRAEKHISRLPLVDIDLRDASSTGDGSYTITGHAATTGTDYTLFENEFVRVRERISPSAFDEVLARKPHVVLNVNHNNDLLLASTRGKGKSSLELSMDDIGLRVFARVNPEVSHVRDLAIQMDDGLIEQMSFAFTIAHEEPTVSEDGERTDILYDISKIGQLYDVCVCPMGANPQTDANLRSLTAAIGRDAYASGLDHRSAPEGDQTPIIATHEVSGGVSTRVLIAQAQSRAKSARARYSTKDN